MAHETIIVEADVCEQLSAPKVKEPEEEEENG